MRITVSLDPDVERWLKDDAHKRGTSFKVALNEAVRKAFRPIQRSSTKRKLFVVKAYDMGLMPGIDYSKANKLADDLEDADLALRRMKQPAKTYSAKGVRRALGL